MRVLLFIFLAIVGCNSVERYPDAKTKFTFKGKSLLVAAQDRVSINPVAEAAYRTAAADAAGSIHVLPIMPAPALELAVTAAKLGLEKNGTKGLDPMAELALQSITKAGKKFGVKFDFIVFVTAEKEGSVSQVTNAAHYAALYEIATKRVIGAARETGNTTAETAVDDLPKGARKVVRLLLDGDE